MKMVTPLLFQIQTRYSHYSGWFTTSRTNSYEDACLTVKGDSNKRVFVDPKDADLALKEAKQAREISWAPTKRA